MSLSPKIATCSFGIVTSGNDIQIFPYGVFDAPRGAMQGNGPWRIDARIASTLIQRVASRSNDILIDYEHQSMLSAKNGKEAPAAGWVSTKSLSWQEGIGLYALKPRWTDKAQKYIHGSEYKYLSPVFTYDSTGAVLDLVSIALTNTPALDGMDEVSYQAAAKQFFDKGASGPGMTDFLSASEIAICNATGIDPTDYLNTKNDLSISSNSQYPSTRLTHDEISVCNLTDISYQDFAVTKANIRQQ